MKEVLYTVLRAIGAYLLLLATSRIIGKKVISQMTFFDYVVAITFGSLAAHFGLNGRDTSLTAGVIMIIFAALSVLSSALAIRSMYMRKLLDSEPVVIIAKGEYVKKNIKKSHMTVELVNALLREKNAFNVMDVEYAIIETNGDLSVLLKSNKQPLTPFDMNVPTPYMGLVAELIIDGKVLRENLMNAGKDEIWLRDALKGRGIADPKDVFFAALDSAGNLYLTTGNAAPEAHGQYGIE